MGFISRSPKRARVWVVVAGLATAAAVLAGLLVTRDRATHPSGGYLGDLAAVLQPPAIEDSPRLSLFPEPAGCAPAPWYASLLGNPCPALANDERRRRVLVIRAAAQRDVDQRQDPEAMHALALIDLLAPGSAEKPLQGTISSLRTAATLSDRPGPILADVAAAYLVRAEREHAPRDLLSAIEIASEALEHDPGNAVARFNLALALQRFGLVEEATEEWRAYLSAQPGNRWTNMARLHLRSVEAPGALPAAPETDAPDSAFAAYAVADPQNGAQLGWCRVLREWADAVRTGDSARAARRLQQAEALASGLARRPGGDQGLRDAVFAIRAHPQQDRTRRLAAAHGAFATACDVYDRAQFRTAAPWFAAAQADAGDSPVLAAWSRLLYGSMVFHSGMRAEGERIIREVAGQTDSVRYPSLAGRARLLLSALLVRNDRYDGALAEGRRAAALLARAGERENEGGAIDAMAVAQLSRRDVDEGYALASRALARLRPYRGSYRLHNVLLVTARFLADDGYPRAALRMQDEGVRVADRNGTPAFIAEARLGLARLRARIGDLAGARADAELGGRAAGRVGDPEVREWMFALWRMADAPASFRNEPARAAASLDSAAAFLLHMNAPLVAMPAVVDGARARLAAGDVKGARTQLGLALAMLEHRRDSVRMEPRRAAVFETARSVVDGITALELGAGRTVAALAYIDRGRETLAPVGRRQAEEDGQVSGPPGEVGLEFAVIGDTLLAWTVSGRRVELSATRIDTVRLNRNVESLRTRLEASASELELRPALSQLYDALLRPVAGRLGPGGTPLVIIADGSIASIPFAALFDAQLQRYLVEDHPLRYAPSLREARRRAPDAAPANATLFVADPAFDPATHPGVPRLAGAAAEVRELASGSPRSTVLADRDATAAAFRSAVAMAGVVHYAGHAVFDDDRPEHSYLLLASRPGEPGTGRLEAGEIAQLDLHRVAVVVLAACQTVRTGNGRAAGLSGLAGAFIAAGAGGAVGGLWTVDDARTRPLMLAFHEAYRVGGNGPEALRRAQLRLLRSPDPALRSPAAWAAFRYVGK